MFLFPKKTHVFNYYLNSVKNYDLLFSS